VLYEISVSTRHMVQEIHLGQKQHEALDRSSIVLLAVLRVPHRVCQELLSVKLLCTLVST
jgi:hypothetical protein